MHHLLKPMKARKSEGHIFIFDIKLYIYNFTQKIINLLVLQRNGQGNEKTNGNE